MRLRGRCSGGGPARLTTAHRNSPAFTRLPSTQRATQPSYSHAEPQQPVWRSRPTRRGGNCLALCPELEPVPAARPPRNRGDTRCRLERSSGRSPIWKQVLETSPPEQTSIVKVISVPPTS